MSPVLYRVLTWYEYSVCYVIIGTSILCTSLYGALDAYTRYRIVETCQPPRSVRLVLFRFASFRFVSLRFGTSLSSSIDHGCRGVIMNPKFCPHFLTRPAGQVWQVWACWRTCRVELSIKIACPPFVSERATFSEPALAKSATCSVSQSSVSSRFYPQSHQRLSARIT